MWHKTNCLTSLILSFLPSKTEMISTEQDYYYCLPQPIPTNSSQPTHTLFSWQPINPNTSPQGPFHGNHLEPTQFASALAVHLLRTGSYGYLPLDLGSTYCVCLHTDLPDLTISVLPKQRVASLSGSACSWLFQ